MTGWLYTILIIMVIYQNRSLISHSLTIGSQASAQCCVKFTNSSSPMATVNYCVIYWVPQSIINLCIPLSAMICLAGLTAVYDHRWHWWTDGSFHWSQHSDHIGDHWVHLWGTVIITLPLYLKDTFTFLYLCSMFVHFNQADLVKNVFLSRLVCIMLRHFPQCLMAIGLFNTLFVLWLWYGTGDQVQAEEAFQTNQVPTEPESKPDPMFAEPHRPEPADPAHRWHHSNRQARGRKGQGELCWNCTLLLVNSTMLRCVCWMVSYAVTAYGWHWYSTPTGSDVYNSMLTSVTNGYNWL